MSDKTGIQWCDSTWNPLRGCSRVSEGCRNCYAERVAARFSGPGLPYEGLARMHTDDGSTLDTSAGRVHRIGTPRWTGEVRLIEEHLADPLRWKRPRRIFVNSMSDLFHPKVPDEWIDRVFAVMALSPRHTFQVLTKRPERMRQYFENLTERTTRILIECDEIDAPKPGRLDVPLPNVWLGVSVEDQATAEARVPLLLQTPAAVRFVSYEPALGPVDFGKYLGGRGEVGGTRPRAGTGGTGADRFGRADADRCPALTDDRSAAASYLDWIIVGGESGPGARPFDIAWARQTIAACEAAGVACFVKQLGARPYDGEEPDHDPNGADEPRWLRLRDRAGADPAEWPEDLRVREFPEARRG